MTDTPAAVDDFLAARARQAPAAAPATASEIWDANWQEAGLHTMGAGAVYGQARADIVNAIEAAAGKPLGDYARQQGVTLGAAGTPDENIGELANVAATLPEDARKHIEPLLDWRRNAESKAAAIERTAADVNANTYGLSANAVRLAAGIARQAVDPLNVAAMAVTAPIGGEGTLPLLQVFARLAAAAGAAQLLQEPIIQSTRAGLGLSSGFEDAAGDVVGAAAGGAAIGGGLTALLRGGAWALRLARRGLAIERPENSAPMLRSAAEPLGESASPIAGHSEIPLAPADLDAAAHLAERDQAIEAMAPASTDQVQHGQLIADTAIALEEGRPVPNADTALRLEPMERSAGLTDTYEGEPTDGMISYRAVNAAGEERLQADFEIRGERAELMDIAGPQVKPFDEASAIAARNTIGPAELRNLLRQFQELHPEVKTITAKRISGARFGGGIDHTEPVSMTISLPSKRAPEPAISDMPLPKEAHAPAPELTPEPAPIAAKAKGGPAARPEATWSLLEFLASRGGLRNDDPLIADVRGSIGRDQHFVPGFGNLIRNPAAISEAARRGGKYAPMTLDAAREAAVKAGYLADAGAHTGGTSKSTVNDLLDAIDKEAGGAKQYRGGMEPARNVDPAQRAHELNTALDQALGEVDIDPAEVSEKLRDRVLEIMDKERVADPLEAYERAVMEETQHGAETGETERIGEHIPGWDVPDDAGAAREPGGAPAESGKAGAGEAPRKSGARDSEAPGEPGAELGDPALAADAARVLDEAGGDFKIVLDENGGAVSAREALASAEEDATAARELAACAAMEATE